MLAFGIRGDPLFSEAYTRFRAEKMKQVAAESPHMAERGLALDIITEGAAGDD